MSSELKELLRSNARKIQSKWRKIVTGSEQKRIRDHLKESEEEPKFVKFVDKIGFTFGVLNIVACQYFLLNIPEYFSIWYCGIVPIILISRFYHFKSLNWHYFLIDFCYFVNICTLLNLSLLKDSRIFSKVCFIHATGTLPLAIPIWRNSLVFHDYDKIVSVYIHILPCMLYYTIRWHNTLKASDHSLDGLYVQDYVLAILLYLFWQIIYILKTEILDKEKFNANPDLLTSLRWMSKDTKNPLARSVLKLLRMIRLFEKHEEYDSTSMKTKGVFVMSQFAITLVSLLPSYIIYKSSTLHLLYIAGIFTVSVFNGASFYIEVFSVRYHSQLEKLEKMHRIAIEARSVAKRIEELSATDVSNTLHQDLNGSDTTLDEISKSLQETSANAFQQFELEKQKLIDKGVLTGSEMGLGTYEYDSNECIADIGSIQMKKE
jgi:hypothetical protein